MEPESVFTTLHLHHNLQIKSISNSVTLQKAELACQWQTLQLIDLFVS